MDSKRSKRNFECPVEVSLSVLGGKWKGLILFHLQKDTRRFNELQRLLPGITQRMLARQLRELESSNIVQRKIYQQSPPKVEYSLTEFGLTLSPILQSLHEWGKEYIHVINNLQK